MANTPLRKPIHDRPNEELLDDLSRELRSVAVNESDLPYGDRVVAHVREVCAIHAELAKRRIDYGRRVEQLSDDTGWQILALLNDCLAYPKLMPYVRERDGIRRHLRCQLCSKSERIPDAKLFWFCDECMHRVLDSVRERAPISGIILFRTYNADSRCTHADADTVLATDQYSDLLYGVCERCINNEIERRRSG